MGSNEDIIWVLCGVLDVCKVVEDVLMRLVLFMWRFCIFVNRIFGVIIFY